MRFFSPDFALDHRTEPQSPGHKGIQVSWTYHRNGMPGEPFMSAIQAATLRAPSVLYGHHGLRVKPFCSMIVRFCIDS